MEGKQLHEGNVYMAYIAEEAEKLSNMGLLGRGVQAWHRDYSKAW